MDMNNHKLNIDEIASIRNKYWKQLDDKFRKENPDKDIPMEPEPSDEECDISIIEINDKEYYIDLNNDIYEIGNDNQIGKLVWRNMKENNE